MEVQQLVTSATPTPNAPQCVGVGTTGETNNLFPTGSCCPFGGDTPGIQFLESDVPFATRRHARASPPTRRRARSSRAGYGQAAFTTSGNLVGQSNNAALQPKTCSVTVSGAAPGSSATAFVTCDTPSRSP